MAFVKDPAQAIQEDNRRKAAENYDFNRFFLKEGEEKTIVFMDGVLNASGAIDAIGWYEHFDFNAAQKKGNRYVCLADEETGTVCPICQSGNDRMLVFGLTVLDRTGYIKDGKPVKNIVRQFVFSNNTYVMLQKFAKSQPTGLRGMQFEVSRTGSKKPRVGDVFVPLPNRVDIDKLIAQLKAVKGADYSRTGLPFDYTKIVKPMTVEALVARGFGATGVPVGDGGGAGGGISHNDMDDDIPFE